MARKTIAQLREEAVTKLAKRRWEEPSDEQLQETRSVMNSYYRLCGREEQLLELDNTEATCNLASTKRLENSAEKWRNRLNVKLEPYNAHLEYFGYFPTICEKGTTRDLDLAHFYE